MEIDTMGGVDDFRQAMERVGLRPPAVILPGRSRFPGVGKPSKDKSGWCWLSADGEGGAYGDWSTGLSQTWQAKSPTPKTKAEREAHTRRLTELQWHQVAEEYQLQKKQHEDAARRAQKIWAQAPPAPKDHAYLRKKQIEPHGLRLDAQGRLIVPVTFNRCITSLQFIDGDGEKRFLLGGKIQQGSFILGDPKKGGTLLVCEGVATGASLHEATSYPVVCAFSANKLKTVAEEFRFRVPGATILVAGDNDIREDGKPNVGLDAATAAADAVGGILVMPDLDGKKCDWNDVRVARGRDGLRTAFKAAMKKAESRMKAATANQQPSVSGVSVPLPKSTGKKSPLPKQAYTQTHDVQPDDSLEQRTDKTLPQSASVSGKSVSCSTEWPEFLPVKAELRPVLPLPIGMVPAPFRDRVKDVSDRMQCPPDFIAVGLVVMTGAIIGAGCAIRPKRHDDWFVVPNLWGGVVGRPSMLKTPAIAEALKPLEALELDAKKTYDEQIAKHDAELEAYKAQREALQGDMRKAAKGKTVTTMEGLKYDFAHLKEPAAPTWRRYKTNDATIEKMTELQRDNPRGMLLFRDELIGLIATWEREHHEADRAYYLEGWIGTSSYITDRIGRGTLYVEILCVSIFGGIVPSKFTSYLHGAMRGLTNDGFVQRLQLMVYPDEPSNWTLIDSPINADAKKMVYEVIRQLSLMDFTQYGACKEEGLRMPYYRFDEGGQQVFYAWLESLEKKLRAGDDEPVVLEHLGKYRSLMPSLALIFHLLDLAHEGPGSTRQVSQAAAERAAAWCDYLESHARRIYGMVTNMTTQAAARLSAKLSQGALPDTFTVRDIYRKDWSLLDDKVVIEKALDELVSLGWLKEKVTPPAPGQRGKTEYVTNPSVKAKTHGQVVR